MKKAFQLTLAVLVLLAVLGAGWLKAVAEGDDDDDDDHHSSYGRESFEGKIHFRGLSAAPQNAKYTKECAACHMAYPPGLLPSQSWTKIMGGLKNHFGEDASLDPKASDEIKGYLLKNSADANDTGRLSRRINDSIGNSDAPIRITETNYFKRKHHELDPSVFKRKSIGSPSNCVACHSGAEKGSFNEHSVRIPKW